MNFYFIRKTNFISKIFILLPILITSCVNSKNARYFKPVDSTELSYVPMNQREYQMYPKFAYLEKGIRDSLSNYVGEFIVQAYDNANEQYFFSGILLPLFPVFFMNNQNNKIEDKHQVLGLGLNFYDSCQIFNNLNKYSFLIQINGDEKNNIYCDKYGFYKNKKDCGLKIVDESKTMYSVTYFFKSKLSIRRIKSIKLIPTDDEAKQIIKPIKFKKRRKFYFEYFFGFH